MAIDGYEGPYQTKLDWIVYYIDGYWRKTLRQGVYRTPTIYQGMERYSGTFYCGSSALSRNNAWYCGAGHYITWDTNFIGPYFNWASGGDAAAAAILAHEWGHATEALLGLSSKRLGTSIWRELYADCQSGAWTDAMARSGHFDTIAPGDLQEAVNAIYALGDPPSSAPWDADGVHGSSDQRYSFFVYGYRYGPQACINYVTDG